MLYEGIFFGQFVPKIKNDEGQSLMVIQMIDIHEAETVKFFVPIADYKKMEMKKFISRNPEAIQVTGVTVNEEGDYPLIEKLEALGQVKFTPVVNQPSL